MASCASGVQRLTAAMKPSSVQDSGRDSPHALLQRALGLQDPPRAAQQGIGAQQAEPGQQRERADPIQCPAGMAPVVQWDAL
jgi:hypothetical protein